jgi:hypothetical protein
MRTHQCWGCMKFFIEIDDSSGLGSKEGLSKVGRIHGSRHGILVSTMVVKATGSRTTHSKTPAAEYQNRLGGMGLKRKIVSDSLCSICA